jgi:hypothetical protein
VHELVGPLCSAEEFFCLNIATTLGAEQSLCAINEWMPGRGNEMAIEEAESLLKEAGEAALEGGDLVSGHRVGIG